MEVQGTFAVHVAYCDITETYLAHFSQQRLETYNPELRLPIVIKGFVYGAVDHGVNGIECGVVLTDLTVDGLCAPSRT
jgi:hypothetical protein